MCAYCFKTCLIWLKNLQKSAMLRREIFELRELHSLGVVFSFVPLTFSLEKVYRACKLFLLKYLIRPILFGIPRVQKMCDVLKTSDCP